MNIEVKEISFTEKVLNFITDFIPPGKVATYKDVAQGIGSPLSARAVGTSLKKNNLPIIIPCHRVISSNRKIGGYFGSKDLSSPNVQKKILLLESEGLEVVNGKIDLKRFRINIS